jgi:hypothetical protein
MNTRYIDNINECDGSFCELFTGVFGNFIIYGILFAVMAKLFRAEKLAYFSLNAAILVPTLIMLTAMALSFPIVLIVIIFNYFNVLNDDKWLVSTLIVAALALILYINDYRNNRTMYSIEWWNIKGWYQSYMTSRFLSSDKIKYAKRSNEEHLTQLDNSIHKEIEQRFLYQLLIIGLSIFMYFWIQDFQVFQSTYSFLDNLSVLVKYPLLFLFLALIVYGYTKYYNIFAKQSFNKIVSMATILEKEKKYIYFKDKNPSGFTIDIKEPRTLREQTKYYYFELFEDGDEGVFAYWINPRIDFEHYVNVMEKIKLIGVENFLDSCTSKTNEAM